MLETDSELENGIYTYGVRLAGEAKLLQRDINYSIEYAKQNFKSGSQSYKANYINLDLKATIFNNLVFKFGYELLGSDNAEYGFSTSLATLHKFNGWSDQFLFTPKEGLEDFYVGFSGNMLGGKWDIAFHEFRPSESNNDKSLGNEVDLSYVKKLGKNYTLGMKSAFYDAGDNALNKVDTDKIWVWLSAKF